MGTPAKSTKPKSKNESPAETAAEVLAKVIPLVERRFKAAEHEFNHWVVYPLAETTLEQILDESYWTDTGRKLRINDIIVVLPEDSSWRVELIVRAAGAQFAEVIVKAGTHQIFDAPADHSDRLTANFKIEFVPADKWRVLRDGVVLQKGMESQKRAEMWLSEHTKSEAKVARKVTI